MTISGEMRDRIEAWRVDQHKKTGRIPTLADAARMLVHIGLRKEGFPYKGDTDVAGSEG